MAKYVGGIVHFAAQLADLPCAWDDLEARAIRSLLPGACGWLPCPLARNMSSFCRPAVVPQLRAMVLAWEAAAGDLAQARRDRPYLDRESRWHAWWYDAAPVLCVARSMEELRPAG